LPLNEVDPTSKIAPELTFKSAFMKVAVAPASVPPTLSVPPLTRMLPVPEIEAPASMNSPALLIESSVACAPDIVYEPVSEIAPWLIRSSAIVALPVTVSVALVLNCATSKMPGTVPNAQLAGLLKSNVPFAVTAHCRVAILQSPSRARP
jgi:hypothetical protein